MRQLSKTFRVVLVVCIYLSSTHFVVAQDTTFIRPASSGEITLATDEDSLYQDHLSSVFNSSVTIVRIAHIQNYMENQVLVFQLPGTSTPLTVTPAEVESTDSVHYSWSGLANESGFFSITCVEDLFSGFIQTDSGAWTILPLREHYSLLIQHDISALDTIDCVVGEGESSSTAPDYCSEAYNTCPAVIDVLLFFTDEAIAITNRSSNTNMKILTMNSFVKTLENSVNLAIENSDIPNKRVRFRWVAYNPEYASTDDVADLVSNFVADISVMEMLNQTFRADLGIFISHVVFDDGFGYANIGIDGNPSASHRHAAVSFFAMLAPRWTLAHELTHLLGAGHNWCSNVPCSSCTACNERNYCNHGYRFNAGGEERKTIHAIFNENGLVRILHFSNPNVDYLGESTGVFGDEPAYNAQIIRNTGCLAAAYVTSPEVKTMISGLTKLCGPNGVFSPATYSATILQPAQGFPGQAPYTISWWWNETGIFTYQTPDVFLGTGNQITITEVPACDYFTLHIRVESADAVIFTASKVVLTNSCSDCEEEERTVKSDGPPLSNNFAIKLYPNPTAGEFSAEIHADIETEAVLTISSMDGKLRHDLGRHQLSKGLNSIPVGLGHLPNGLYAFHFVSTDRQHTTHISLQKN
jgi:hypothetical protein